MGSAAQWDGQRRGVAGVPSSARAARARQGEKKEERRRGKRKREKEKEKRGEKRERERDEAGFAAATAGSVEYAWRSSGTQCDTRNEERGRRLISVSDGENAGKDFEELGSRTEEEFEMIRAQRRKDFEKNIFSE